MRRHKAICSCAQRIIHKVITDICSGTFTKECSRMHTWASAWGHGRDCYLKPICEENVYGKGVYWISVQFSRVTQSCLTLCNAMNRSMPDLPVHPSSTPRVHSDSCPSSQWCHPAISSSVVPFSSCPQSLPASESFPMSQLFTRGGQSARVSALASVLPKKSQGWISFRMDWLDLLAIQGTLRSLLQHHSSKASILWCSAFFTVQLSYPYMTTGKTIALTRRTFVGKVMSLLFNMLSRLVISFLPRSKHLLISWLKSPSAVILEPRKSKSDTVSTVSSLLNLGLRNN